MPSLTQFAPDRESGGRPRVLVLESAPDGSVVKGPVCPKWLIIVRCSNEVSALGAIVDAGDQPAGIVGVCRHDCADAIRLPNFRRGPAVRIARVLSCRRISPKLLPRCLRVFRCSHKLPPAGGVVRPHNACGCVLYDHCFLSRRIAAHSSAHSLTSPSSV